MLKSSIKLVKDNAALITSGFFLILFSVFGQTVFIGVFLPDLRAAFNLSQSEIGTLYGLATLISAVIMIWSGRLLDRIPMLRFLVFTLIGLAAGCLMLAFSYGIISLFLALLFLRQFGQGQMVFVATSSVNRYMTDGRGRALSVLHLASPLQIAFFPPLALVLLEYSDWRILWICFAGVTIFILLPLFTFLLKNHQRTTHSKWEAEIKQQEESSGFQQIQLGRKDALSDWKFYILISVLIIPACFTTAIFFFQSKIAMEKGITALQFTGIFPFFMIGSIFCAFCAGVIIDYIGEAPTLAMQPVFYFSGLSLMVFFDSLALLCVGFALIGGAEGFNRTSGGPVLARLYGTKYYGEIKSVLFAAAIISSAVSPALVGILLDQGYGLMDIFAAFIFYIAIVICILMPVLKKFSGKTKI